MYKRIELSVPATSANVGPGYDIFAMALENPRDEFVIEKNKTGKINIKVDKAEYKIPVNEKDNSAGLAARILLDKKGIKQGVNIFIKKSIPHGGGMGTTGASAVAAVYAINMLFGLKLSNNRMIDFARRGEVASGGSPHADNVAAALLGGFIFIQNYSPMKVLKILTPEFPVVLAAIRKSQRTTRGFITYDIGQENLKQQMANCSSMIHSLHEKNVKAFGKSMSNDFIHEPVRGAAIDNYFGIKKKILKSGALGCTVSGGGSSVIVVCEKFNQDSIADLMEKEFSSNKHYVTVFKTKVSNEGVRILSLQQ